MSIRSSRRACPILLALLVAAPLAHAQNNTADTAKLVEVLQLKAGDVVAEIGAGSGDLTLAIARHVGTDGRVYTSELGAERLAKLRDAVQKSGLPQVHVVEGNEAHANLPEGCCDAVFMRNVYHHFADPRTMNESIVRALKPGARLAVIDFPPQKNLPTGPPGKRGDAPAHGVGADVVADELRASGLTILTSEERPNRWFVVVAQKPQP